MSGEIEILVDADACPVKEEIYRVAGRHGLRVVLVANSYMRVPRGGGVELVVVGDGLDAADDWISEHAGPRTIVVTADIPLASRCAAAGAPVLGPNGRSLGADTIGAVLATRNLMDSLRSAGEITGGPKPFSPADRSRFLSSLHQAVVRTMNARTGQ
ncbi:MAG TPA: YaiI/YqxD family protein [Hyphomicrobiales bacterium]|nr:YaiI/YqxD family protein [Rhodobiaceae bacterium]HXK53233.1 YaiI/YqxD family protein [Hyphomicrobiales bacterium]